MAARPACASPTCARCSASPTAATSCELFTLAMRGEIAAALEMTQRLYRAGADPAEMLLELSEFCHFVTRVKISEAALADPAVSEAERAAGGEIAKSLGMGALEPRLDADHERLRRREGFAAPARLARHGARPPRLCRRPSRPRGGFAQARRGRRRRRAAAARAAPAPAPGRRRARRRARPGAGRPCAASGALRGCRRARPRQARPRASCARWSTTCASSATSPAASSSRRTPTRRRRLAATLAKKLQDWTGERWMIALVPGRRRADLARERESEGRAEARRRRRPSGRAQGAGPVPGREDRRRARAGDAAARGAAADRRGRRLRRPGVDEDI